MRESLKWRPIGQTRLLQTFASQAASAMLLLRSLFANSTGSLLSALIRRWISLDGGIALQRQREHNQRDNLVLVSALSNADIHRADLPI